MSFNPDKEEGRFTVTSPKYFVTHTTLKQVTFYETSSLTKTLVLERYFEKEVSFYVLVDY